MKCLNCGCTSENYLCAACTNEAVLDKIFKEIRFYKPDTCENPYLLEFASGLTGNHPGYSQAVPSGDLGILCLPVLQDAQG